MVNESENLSEKPKEKLLEARELKGRKPIISIILLVIVVAFALWGLFKLQSASKTSNNQKTEAKQINLTDEQRQALEAEVTDTEAQINKLPANASAQDR